MDTVARYHPSRHDARLLSLQFGVFFLSFTLPTYIVRNPSDTPTAQLLDILLFGGIVAGALSTALFAFGLHSGAPEDNHKSLSIRLALAITSVGLVLYSPVLHNAPAYVRPDTLALSLAVAFLGIYAIRTVYFRVAGAESNRQPIIVIGAGEKAAALRKLIDRTNPLRYEIVGYYNASSSSKICDAIPRARLIDPNQSLLDVATTKHVRTIVIAVDDRRGSLPINALLDAKLNGIEVTDIVSFCECQYSLIKFEYMSPSWIVFSSDFHLDARSRLTKRAFDLVAASALIALLSPLMLLIAIASLIESRGKDPVLYTQTRVGYGGRNFQLYKFRSMTVAAEQDGTARWASTRDDRVTPVGKILRRYRLDELPQLINILAGDMSLVGPRPERPEFVDTLSKVIPFYTARHWVKPGLAGWAQVMYPYGACIEDAKRKLEYDLHYMKHVSVLRDVLILLRTAEVVVIGNGVR